MNPDTTPTPRTDEHPNFANGLGIPTVATSFARQLERELAEKTNEVARLRELLTEASYRIQEPDFVKEIEDALAPAPEEPVIQDSRITELVCDCHLWKQPMSCPRCEEPASEWRELGEDEVICENDELFYEPNGRSWERCGETYSGLKPRKLTNYRFRTRRPLPKQEEMPLEDRVKQAHEEFKNLARVEPGSFITEYFIREILILRDEIQKLKEAR
jgi:hypothetical protein